MEARTKALPTRRKNDACCTVVSCSLSGPRTLSLAERLKAVADPTRLRLLDMLTQQLDPICVCDITPHFEQNQPTISHHLKLLRDAGLIDTEKRGIWAYYWATPSGQKTLTAVKALE
jgi:ArsR family transcriptional regulator